jgi:hypothetical protein
MSIPEEKQPFVGDCTVSPTHTATLMAQEGGDGCMGSRRMTVGRYEEIRRRLGEGRGLREISGHWVFTLHSAGVRDGFRGSPDAAKEQADPLWMLQLEWPAIIHELGLGHPLKFIWEEKSSASDDLLQFLEAILPQVPAVPGSSCHGA